jgi:hypothetical protein
VLSLRHRDAQDDLLYPEQFGMVLLGLADEVAVEELKLPTKGIH